MHGLEEAVMEEDTVRPRAAGDIRSALMVADRAAPSVNRAIRLIEEIAAEHRGGLTLSLLQQSIAERRISDLVGLSTAELAVLTTSPVFRIGPMLILSLWPHWDYDQWKEFERELEKGGGKTDFSGPEWNITYHKQEGYCDLAVKSRIDVTAHKNGDDDPLNGNKGVTKYMGMEVQTGHTFGPGNAQGCFVHIVIKIAIHLNLSAAGKQYTEDNKAVKDARIKAGKSASFKELPLEFILLHEEQHAKEMSDALSKIAQKVINCAFGDSSDQIKKLSDALQAEADKMTDDAKKGKIQGEVERRIRMKTWEEWDRRHP
jgi:hypothetical protein